jgi:hypothetical protein
MQALRREFQWMKWCGGLNKSSLQALERYSIFIYYGMADNGL